jgi:hypothetical protein
MDSDLGLEQLVMRCGDEDAYVFAVRLYGYGVRELLWCFMGAGWKCACAWAAEGGLLHKESDQPAGKPRAGMRVGGDAEAAGPARAVVGAGLRGRC